MSGQVTENSATLLDADGWHVCPVHSVIAIHIQPPLPLACEAEKGTEKEGFNKHESILQIFEGES